MISLEQCKKIDPQLENLSDEDIEKLRDSLYAIAELALESYFDEKSGSKNPVGVYGLINNEEQE